MSIYITNRIIMSETTARGLGLIILAGKEFGQKIIKEE